MTIAAYGGRTERAVQALLAKRAAEQQTEPEVVTRSIFELRQLRKEQEQRDAEDRLKFQRERIQREKREAAEIIRRGRIAARKIAIRENYRQDSARIYETIVRRICKAMGITLNELMANRRNARTVLARQAVFYWSQRLTRLSMPDIGRRMGGRDHTTVYHGICVYPKKRAAQGRYLREAR